MRHSSCKLFPLLFIFTATIFWTASPVPAEVITVSGCSVSNIGYLQELAKEYERRTGKKVLVRGGGSMIGLEDLRSGRVDLAAACREKLEDDPKNIEFIQVAWDALVFIVHIDNPMDNISFDNIKAIFTGRINNWKQLEGRNAPIKLFISRPGKGLSGVEHSTSKLILKGEKLTLTPKAQTIASTAIVEQMVEMTPEGFASTGFASARKRKVNMLKVNGVYPTKENIINDRYPFKRPLFLLITKNPKSEVKEFVEFSLSKDGQKFISSLGIPSFLDIK